MGCNRIQPVIESYSYRIVWAFSSFAQQPHRMISRPGLYKSEMLSTTHRWSPWESVFWKILSQLNLLCLTASTTVCSISETFKAYASPASGFNNWSILPSFPTQGFFLAGSLGSHLKGSHPFFNRTSLVSLAKLGLLWLFPTLPPSTPQFLS